MDTRLKDRIAIITGASSGLGKATALRFAAVGARVICADLKQAEPPVEDEINKKYGADRSIFVACDVASEDQVKSLVERAVAWGGRLDIVCSYAGVSVETGHGLSKRIHETPVEDFDLTWSINTRGMWLCCKYAIAQMLVQDPLPPNARGERTRGWIVNAASLLGFVGLGSGPLPCYVPSKHAAIGITKRIALDYARDKIHCNALAPSFVRSPMIASLIATDEAEAGVAAAHPWNALGEPKDIADAALFLCSDEASFITGHTMVIDGGYTAQ